MVKHIVMWKYNPNVVEPNKLAMWLKEDFYDLEGKIEGLVDIEFHCNILDSSTANMVLETIHTDKEALSNYQNSPLHKEIVKKYKELFFERSCADYIF